eukprot:Skav210461  [mRNA]  locus=scaffold1443:33748:34413:+ [translate_table: standard]
MTTIPFGHVDPDDLLAAEQTTFDKPLWKVLFENLETPNGQAEVEHLMGPANHWCARRVEKGDIKTVDPDVWPLFSQFMECLKVFESTHLKVEESDKSLEKLKLKLEGSVQAMLAIQLKRLGGDASTDHYKVHVKNIEEWKANKLDVAKKAHFVLMDESARLKREQDDALENLIAYSFQIYMKHDVVDGNPNVDVDLMRELESIVHPGHNPSEARVNGSKLF